MNRDDTIKKAVQQYPYEYVGGGYYRMKNSPKGVSAPIIHGDHIVEHIITFTVNMLMGSNVEDS